MDFVYQQLQDPSGNHALVAHGVDVTDSVLATEISDSTGDLTALFYGRSHIPGLICGARVRFRGAMGIRKGSPVMINPAYELLAPGDVSPPAGEGS